jgi:MoxR-like ATPase
MFRAVQALALLDGRDYALPEDVKRLAVPVFAHRVLLNTRVSLTQRSTDSTEKVIKEILTQVEVPV